MDATYRIVRFYERGYTRKRVLARGLTLDQAQAHCNSPQTSSRTASGWRAAKRTREMGGWFDGFEKES